jgi:hypothetical protein
MATVRMMSPASRNSSPSKMGTPEVVSIEPICIGAVLVLAQVSHDWKVESIRGQYSSFKRSCSSLK